MTTKGDLSGWLSEWLRHSYQLGPKESSDLACKLAQIKGGSSSDDQVHKLLVEARIEGNGDRRITRQVLSAMLAAENGQGAKSDAETKGYLTAIAALEEAKREFLAWVEFNGINLDPLSVYNGTAFLPFKVICRKCRNTKDGLGTHISSLIRRRKIGPDVAKIQLVDTFRIQQRQQAKNKLLASEETKRLHDFYAPIAGRKDNWSLLNITKIESLKNMIGANFPNEAPPGTGLDAAEIMKNKGLFLFDLLKLIAVKNGPNRSRTAQANSRTKEQRAAAARKGHLRRKGNSSA